MTAIQLTSRYDALTQLNMPFDVRRPLRAAPGVSPG